MNELFKIFEATDLLDLVPDGTKETSEKDGVKALLEREGNTIKFSLKIEPSKDAEYDDTPIKELIEAYKERINELDDTVFVESVEAMKEWFDVNEFNKLLDLESFDRETANKVTSMISLSSDIIRDLLKEKIKDMEELSKCF